MEVSVRRCLDIEVGFGVPVAIRDVAGVVCVICVVGSVRSAESQCVVVCEGAVLVLYGCRGRALVSVMWYQWRRWARHLQWMKST